MTNIEHQLLQQNIESLQKAAAILKKSYEICKKIDIKNECTYEESTEFEAFAARFARLVDLLIQKVFRTIDIINLAPEGTIRDSINRAEKNQLIDHADLLIEMKRCRNQLVHEYLIENLLDLIQQMIEFCPLILNYVERTIAYCKKL